MDIHSSEQTVFNLSHIEEIRTEVDEVARGASAVCG